MVMRRTRALSYATILLGVVLVVGVWVSLFTRSTVFDESIGGSHVRYEADRRYVMPEDCITVRWDVDAVQSITLNDEPVPAQGERVTCPSENMWHTLRIVDAAGEPHKYTAYLGVFLDGKTSRLILVLSIVGLFFYTLIVAAVGDLPWLSSRLKPDAPSIAAPRRWFNRLDVLVLGALAVVVGGFSGAVARAMLTDPDFVFWLDLAQRMGSSSGSPEAVPHVLFPVLTAVVDRIVPGYGGVIVAAAGAILTSWGVYLFLRPAFSGQPWQSGALLNGLLTLALMLVGPIFVLTPSHLYLGYLPAHVYHSPTMYVLKPFAIPLFAAALYALRQPAAQGRASTGLITAVAVLAALAPFAKPNLTIVLVPALFLMIAWQLWHRRRLRWGLLTALLVPSLGVLAFQFLLTFGGSESIQLNPLGFLEAHDRVSWLLVPMFLLSIAFPLAVYGFYFDRARRDLALNFAWLLFVIGASYSYLLTETARLRDGNFAWSGQIAVFVLFVASARFLLQTAIKDGAIRWKALSRRFWTCMVVLDIHIVCGVYWYITNLMRLRYW